MGTHTTTHHYDRRWADSGNCAGLAKQNANLYDHIFFPEKGRPSTHPAYEKFCMDCPVRAMCYKYALVNDLDGIWGNTTKAERDALPLFVRGMLMQEAGKFGYIEKFAAPLVPHRITVTVLIDEFVELSEDILEPQDFRFNFQYKKYVERTRHMIEVMEDI
jgi:hypothetical protein